MQPELLAYLAGVMDSDGYFTIARRPGAERRDLTRAILYDPRLGCGQIDRLIPDLLCATFGGYVNENRQRESLAYVWQVCSRTAVAAAAELLPYQRLKRRQCEIVIELGRMVRSKRAAGGASRLTDEEMAAREILCKEIRRLNHWRGREEGEPMEHAA